MKDRENGEMASGAGTEAFVFISYSSNDGDVAGDVCDYLERSGLRCWIAPRNVLPGSNYASQIVAAIRGCSAFVLLASHHTNISGHVSNEVELAFDAKKTIIPCKIEEMTFTDEYSYYLARKHWIDAFPDRAAGLRQLRDALFSDMERAALPGKEEVSPSKDAVEGVVPREEKHVADEPEKKDYTRAEIADIIRRKSRKFPYNILDKIYTREKAGAFRERALKMFGETAEVYFRGKRTEMPRDPIGMLADEFLSKRDACVQVRGLPGVGKNMLLQLVFYELLDRFERGESDRLPYYIALNYFEKFPYNKENEIDQMRSLMQNEYHEFFDFLAQEPAVVPVFFVDALRDYSVRRYTPESVLAEILRPYGKFARMTATDVGLVTARSRLKKVIPITGDHPGYTVRIHPVALSERASVMTLIGSVIEMYGCDASAEDIYEIFDKMHYTSVDIFLVRMIVTQLEREFYSKDLDLSDMYEELALSELGDRDRLEEASEEVFRYIFDDEYVPREELAGKSWSLPNKHHTYREFLIAYYFMRRIETYRESEENAFFGVTLTATANHFLLGFLNENYTLQETLLNFVEENYQSFDIRQRSNAAYWLGRVRLGDLGRSAVSFLTSEFDRLKPAVKTCNRFSKENLDAQFLFRSVCGGLLSHGKAGALDDYLCLLVTNDVANAVNRGETVQYFGEDHQNEYGAYDLDTDPDRGEEAIGALNARIERALSERNGGFVENNLITLLTILQARAEMRSKHAAFGIAPYLRRALDYIRAYRRRPTKIQSGKILYYVQCVEEEFGRYLADSEYNVAADTYNRYKQLRDVKRTQWVSRGVSDPESVEEHSYGAWLMAMFFLPEDAAVEGYNKREILDMLLIHDLAEGELGDRKTKLSEPRRELKEQNEVLRKLFVKGTYPGIANMTYYYNVWTGYYNGININAKIARDINLVQSIYTFCEYYGREPGKFTPDELDTWLAEKADLTTDLGYMLFERLIEQNGKFASFVKGSAGAW